MSQLVIKDLTAQVKRADDTEEPIEILKGVNLTLNSGETHAIMGPNGSGNQLFLMLLLDIRNTR